MRLPAPSLLLLIPGGAALEMGLPSALPAPEGSSRAASVPWWGTPAAHPSPGSHPAAARQKPPCHLALPERKLRMCMCVCIHAYVCILIRGPQKTPVPTPCIGEGCMRVAAATASISLSQSGEHAGEPSRASLAGLSNQSKSTNQHPLSKAYSPQPLAAPILCLASGGGHRSRPLRRSPLRRLLGSRGGEANR